MDNAEALLERREYQRYNIPAPVCCTFYEETLQLKGGFQGFIQDISCGGVSLEIKDDFLRITESMLLYTNIEMNFEFNFPDGKNKINISGTIRWYKRIKKNDRNLLYLGVQFHNLDAQRTEIVKRFISLGTGDKNLIWNLWDNIIATTSVPVDS